MPDTELSIACGVDESLVLPLVVLLTSIQDHLDPAASLVFYLFHCDLPDAPLETISDIVETRPVRLRAEHLTGVARPLPFKLQGAANLLAAELLPTDVSRLLFLDADLLALDDLTKLWRLDLGGRALAAVPDRAIPTCGAPRAVKDCAARGVPEDAVYFNCGVVLCDLDSWRERGATGRLLDYVRRTGDRIDFVHQEALNAVFWDDWLEMPERWNLLAGAVGRPFDTGSPDAWRDPGIAHFSGKFKPWRLQTGTRFQQDYEAVLERVEDLVPQPPRTLKETVMGAYDRHLRNALHGAEAFLWRQRWL
jgi:lipopolysaccharide biosynthesis glycosyltransferase